MVILAALIAMVAACYLAATHDTFPGDADALSTLQGFRSQWLDSAAVAATSTAHPLVALASIFALSLALFLTRRIAYALPVFLALVPLGINLGLKALVERPRPEFSLLMSPAGDPGFPSGHSVHALVLFGLLIFMLGGSVRLPWLRVGLQGLLVLMIPAVGASRVYLGGHWPSDVLGGYLLGGIGLVALIWVRKKLVSRGLD